MKKIFFAFTLIAALSFTGWAQKTEKILKANKWYAVGELNSEKIILTKSTPSKYDWVAEFSDKGLLNYCSITPADIINADATVTKAGSLFCDPHYSYELTGEQLTIKYPVMNWHYMIKTLSNGTIELSRNSEK